VCVCKREREREREKRARAMRKEQRVRQTKHKHKWFLQLSYTDLWGVAHVRRLLCVCVGVCVLKRERESTRERASERKGARERLRTPKRELNDPLVASLQGFAGVVHACTTERLRAHTKCNCAMHQGRQALHEIVSQRTALAHAVDDGRHPLPPLAHASATSRLPLPPLAYIFR